jgi:hypothetical protein
MANVAVIVLAGTDTHADTARLVNGLETAREFADSDGDDVDLVFDGAGTQWIARLEDPDSDYHDLYRAVRDEVAVCDFCVGAFDADAAVDAAGVDRLDDHDGHPSVRSYVEAGYEVVTF